MFIILILIIFTPILFCPLDMLYYISMEKRSSPWIRSIYEIIVLVIFPFLAHSLGLTEDITKLITSEVFYSLSALCIISYFIISYSKSTFTLTGEILFTVAIFGGFVINCLNFIILSFDNNTHTFDLDITFFGSFPIFCMLGTGLIQQYRRCKRCYYWEDYMIEESDL